MMSYLRNVWYVAAWSDEVGDEKFVRTLLDIPVFFLRHKGVLHALQDMCPHRFAPLSLGSIVDDKIRCAYHGLEFTMAGECAGSCIGSFAPSLAKVRTFPVIEQDDFIWIWMGDPALADAALIPRVAFHADPALRYVKGYTYSRASYLLYSDNLMDLTHTAMLHPEFGGLNYQPKYKCYEAGSDIISDYLIEKMPDFHDPTGKGIIRENDVIRWVAPSIHLLDSHITALGSDGAEGETFLIPSAHILTPETEETSHYFWSSGTDADSPLPDSVYHSGLSHAFDGQDKPMIEAVSQRMAGRQFWDLNPVLLAADAGGVRMRRRLAAMIAAEEKQLEDA